MPARFVISGAICSWLEIMALVPIEGDPFVTNFRWTSSPWKSVRLSVSIKSGLLSSHYLPCSNTRPNPILDVRKRRDMVYWGSAMPCQTICGLMRRYLDTHHAVPAVYRDSLRLSPKLCPAVNLWAGMSSPAASNRQYSFKCAAAYGSCTSVS